MTTYCRDHCVDLTDRDISSHNACRTVDRCPGRARHWRIAFRTVGLRTPVCVYCGSPNPRPLTEAEWGDLVDWRRDHKVGEHVDAALHAKYGGA